MSIPFKIMSLLYNKVRKALSIIMKDTSMMTSKSRNGTRIVTMPTALCIPLIPFTVSPDGFFTENLCAKDWQYE